jgi:hypothetical protein
VSAGGWVSLPADLIFKNFNFMNIKSNHLSLFILFLLLTSSLLFSQTTKHWLKYEFPHLTAEGSLWIGTPKGLYQYHIDEDSWSVYGEHNGLPANEVQILLWDGEFLWAATPKGLACGDIKLNKWLNYDTTNGLPGNKIFTIAFQEDYVWIGTDKGAARFDKLIQEWEIFNTKDGLPDSMVYDISVDGDLVYFATAKGLTEYDTNFEKWRYYGTKQGIVSDTIRFIHQTTDFLWLFTDQGPTRFNKKLHSTLSFTEDARLQYSMIKDLIVDNEQFWLATEDGVLIYDPGNNLWRNFQEEMNLPDRFVKALSFSQDNRWFVTKQGVAVFDEKNKSWRRYDKTHGLSSESYEAAAEFMGLMFLVNRNTIDYYKPFENRWYVYPLKDILTISRDKTPYISLDKEKGSFVQINPQIRFSVSGSRFTYRYQKSYQYQCDTKQTEDFSESAKRGDLKAQLSLSKERTINGFYNNTDFSQVLYGVRYKGKKGDLIQEINWGDVRYEQGKNNLIPSIGIFGSSARVEAGPKTERYKRSLVSAKGWSGEKTSASESEFFTGNFQSGGVSLLDVDYIKNTYFRLDTTNFLFPVEEGSEKVYVDDGNPNNNTVNTLEDFVVGGVAGDFDLFHPFLDYSMENQRGEIRFSQPVSDSATVVIEGVSQGMPFQRIIKRPGVINNAYVNRYFAGGMEIIPYSFQLQILDSLGNRHPLSNFGIDVDNNDKVDPQWIDYKQGILSFPELKPFPESVYDTGNPISHYHLQIQFQSEITIFNLSHNHLIRGSEIIIIDGEILSRGDYVLDYTSGTLLILKEGVVAEDSEIEVNYEYYRDSKEKFHLAGVGFAPSDNVQMEVNYFAFDEEQSDFNLKHYNGFDFFSEFKWRIKNIDFKLTPEFARNQGDSLNGNSMHLRTDVSSQKIRLFSVFEKYDRGFKQLFNRKFQLGNIGERIAAGGTYYPFKFLDANFVWNKAHTPKQDNGKKDSEENINGKVLFSKNLYPAISLSARRRILDTENYYSTKETIKGDLDYQVSPYLLKKISLKSMRVYGVWRRSWEDISRSQESNPLTYKKRIYDNQYLRVDLSPVKLVQINSYYRGKSVRAGDSAKGKENHLLNQRQKLFFDVTIDRLSGMNMNVRYQGEVSDYYPCPEQKVHNISIYRSLQSSIRFYPGKWIQILTPFTFELNYQPTWRGYLQNYSEKLNLADKFLRLPFTDELTSSEDNKAYQYRIEWRPLASLILYTDLNSYRITSRSLDSRLQTNIRQINQKVEYSPTIHSLITLQYFRNHEQKLDYSTKVRDNPMIWFENRWNENLQTKLNLTYWRQENRTGKLEEYSSNFSPLIGLTYRFLRSGSQASTAEIRDDLSFSFYRCNKPYPNFDYNSFSNSLAIDYYPVSVLIVRFRLVTTFQNQLNSNRDNLYNLFEFRLTAQF